MDGSGRGERRGDDEHSEHAAAGDGANDAAVTDRVAAAAAELYGVGLDEFTDRRKVLAAAARTAGDKGAATAIAALRKPTRAAWVVNRLARDDPGAPPRLAAAAAALRAAEQAKDGPVLRELSGARGALIDALTGQALAAAGFPDAPPSLRAEVEATLTAALADPGVAGAFAAGTLTRAEHWSGFGQADLGPDNDMTGVGVPGREALGDRPPDDDVRLPVDPAGGRGMPVRRGRRAPAPAAPPAPARSRRSPGRQDSSAQRESMPSPIRPPVRATRVAAAEEERLAREAAERAARDRNNYEDAERTVAAAATAAAEAIAAEDRLEAEVRDLEERLIRARADLTAARLTARRAEAAERRARQARDRLHHP